MFEIGIIVQSNYVEAFKWYEKASNKNFAKAQANLGRFLYDGLAGERNKMRGIGLIREAAESGIGAAKSLLGLALSEDSEKGTDNMKEAISWLHQAAEEHGHTSVFIRLGDCYFHGNGVPIDYSKAHYWWNRAARAGDCKGVQNLVLVAQMDRSNDAVV